MVNPIFSKMQRFLTRKQPHYLNVKSTIWFVYIYNIYIYQWDDCTLYANRTNILHVSIYQNFISKGYFMRMNIYNSFSCLTCIKRYHNILPKVNQISKNPLLLDSEMGSKYPVTYLNINTYLYIENISFVWCMRGVCWKMYWVDTFNGIIILIVLLIFVS